MARLQASTLFSLPEVAQRWKVSVKSVRRLIDAKGLSAIRVGKSLRISESEILRFERQNAT
ncbi:helix-turn-helix domain-containing protein [Bosea sp. BH3]|uniref:helix-turn-helix domain-containing protein n=1 Tax=Bosea sp. BH3 TaxID=2871701 RepID=UPI0021CB8145|nr:helix-turn-helix domain-containing protein [Bosea sp. BH3]